MELCQGDNTPSPTQTNQEHTSRGRHTMQQALNGPDKTTKWINQRTQNYI